MSSEKFSHLIYDINLNLIPPHRFYSGHICGEKREYLEDHSYLTLDYFLYLVERNSLEEIINDNITHIFGKEALNDFKKIILFNIFYHDIGKVNRNFQMKIHGKVPKGDSNHSKYSRKIIETVLYEMFPTRWDFIYLLSETVERHHTRLGDYKRERDPCGRKERKIIEQICKDLSYKFKETPLKTEIFDKLQEGEWDRLFFLLKLIYSLLVLSDSYSTFHFSEGFSDKYPINNLTREQIEKMQISFNSISYNKNLKSGSVSTIDDIRREILIEADRNMKTLLSDTDTRIFMLPVPTGGGKTNISMKLALDILESKPRLKRIFYVFPYINIIEQNSQVIEKTLFNHELFKNRIGLISDIYSKSYYEETLLDIEKDEEKDAKYLQKMLIMNDNFLNNKLNIITTVNFFNSFIKTGGNNRYKFAYLANSIVIIDEVQTLSDKNIRLFYDFIKEASENMNIYFILMSATLPNMEYFVDANVASLIANPKKYFSNKLFKRNKIIMKRGAESIEDAEKIVLNEVKKRKKEMKILITLNTVQSSHKMAEHLSKNKMLRDFQIYLINSTLSSPQRRKIIEEIKQDDGRNKIVVSTQSIEAGVDIDCDFGIRDFAILDSIEQVAGRINRESNPEKSNKSILYVINIKRNGKYESGMIYGGGLRYKITTLFNNEDVEKILNGKKFDDYYKKLAIEVKKIAKDNYPKIKREIADLHYEEINRSIDVIEEKIEKLGIFLYHNCFPIEYVSKYDIEKINKTFEEPILREWQKKKPVITDKGINTQNLFYIWKQILLSTDKFEDIFIRRKISSLVNQFVIAINNLQNKSGGTVEDFFLQNNFIQKENEYDIFYSTDRFFDIYSFDYGLDVEKMKNIFRKNNYVIL